MTQEILLPDSKSPTDAAGSVSHDGRETAIQEELFAPGRSRAARYAQLVVGRSGLWALLKYELIVTLCSVLPGAIGLLLRSKRRHPAGPRQRRAHRTPTQTRPARPVRHDVARPDAIVPDAFGLPPPPA